MIDISKAQPHNCYMTELHDLNSRKLVYISPCFFASSFIGAPRQKTVDYAHTTDTYITYGGTLHGFTDDKCRWLQEQSTALAKNFVSLRSGGDLYKYCTDSIKWILDVRLSY